jgi:drug/metabolite transporter (DMT)-like permease
MSEYGWKRLGHLFAWLGAGLLALGAIVALAFGTVLGALGHPFAALAAAGTALVLFVVAALAVLFASLGRREGTDGTAVAGVLLIVVGVVGWAMLGLGANVLALLGALFVFLAGVLYLVDPARKVVTAAVPS